MGASTSDDRFSQRRGKTTYCTALNRLCHLRRMNTYLYSQHSGAHVVPVPSEPGR